MHPITVAAQQQVPMFCAYDDISRPGSLWDIQLHELITKIAERLGHVHLQQLFQAFHAPIATHVRKLRVCEDLGADLNRDEPSTLGCPITERLTNTYLHRVCFQTD
jgi:hypothetical protein